MSSRKRSSTPSKKPVNNEDDHIHVETAVKPLLRGQLHAVSAVVMMYGTYRFWALAAPDRSKQYALLIYCMSSILVFAWSAVYHIVHWTAPWRLFMRQIDHANIFLLIAGTYTPFCYSLLHGMWRTGILTAVWGLAGIGLTVSAFRSVLKLPRILLVALYLLQGWLVVTILPEMIRRLQWKGIAPLGAAGVVYSLGALTYAFKRPDFWPRVFGYHELFHLATVIANGIFYYSMEKMIIPVKRLE